MSFDPYYTWLGIPPHEQPPNHYRLLGLRLGEANPEVISHAADRQMAHIRTFQSGKHAVDSQRLLNEISTARLCLLDDSRRLQYDQWLQQQMMQAAAAQYGPPAYPPVGAAYAPTEPPTAGAPLPYPGGPYVGGAYGYSGYPGTPTPVPMYPPVGYPAATYPVVGYAPPPNVPAAEPPPSVPETPRDAPNWSPPPNDLRSREATPPSAANAPMPVAASTAGSAAAPSPANDQSAAPSNRSDHGRPRAEPTESPSPIHVGRFEKRSATHAMHMRRRKSPVAETAKIMIGGVVGSFFALLILWYGFGKDPLGVMETHAPLWASRDAASASSGKSPSAPSESHSSAASGGSASHGSPHASGNHGGQHSPPTPQATSNSGSPATNPASQPADASSGAPTTDPRANPLGGVAVPAQPPMNQGLTGTNPIGTLPARSAPKKYPVPSKEEQDEALGAVTTVFDLNAQRTRAEKRDTARRMLTTGRGDGIETAERFVLLRNAASLAQEGGEAALLREALQTMGEHFDFDMLTAQEKMFIKLLEHIHDETLMETYVTTSKALIEDALLAQRFDSALRVAETVYEGCQRAYGKRFRKYVYDGRNSLRKLHQEWRDVEAARESLAQDPDNPVALRTVGRWQALQLGQWDVGIVDLARSGDDPIALAARRDSAGVTDVARQIELADQWHDIALGSATDTPFAERALHWYRVALPKATGLNKQRCETRIDELKKLMADHDQRELSVRAMRAKSGR